MSDDCFFCFFFVKLNVLKAYVSDCTNKDLFFDGDQHSKLEYCCRQSSLDYSRWPQKLLARAALWSPLL